MLKHFFKKRVIQQLICEAYHNVDGFALTKQAIAAHQLDTPEYTYGEICFHTFLRCLDIAKVEKGDVFYDLGSGVGKNTLIAALYCPLAKSYGIELLPNSYQSSQACLKHIASQKKATSLLKNTEVNFINADMRDIDFSNANVVFINATAFWEPLWPAIKQRLQQLQSGTRLIISSKLLTKDSFDMYHTETMLMSWGMAQVFFYVKK